MIGYLDGRPVSRDRLDRRLAALRAGGRSEALPVPGSAEDRQLTRWVAQVLLTEELCAEFGADDEGAPTLDAASAVEYGSITAAAYEGSACVRAGFLAVTAAVTVDEDEVLRYWSATAEARPDRWILRHRLGGGPPERLGPVTLAELPAAVALAVETGRDRASDALGEHSWTVERVLPGDTPAFGRDAGAVRALLLGVARRRAFAHWLDRARAGRLTLVEGLEHPGDPRQPDNHHKH